MAKRQREKRQNQESFSLMLMPAYEEKLEETLGNRLRELRRQQGLSLRALAEKSGLSANTLSLIENGKTSPSVATLQQIAIALSIPITAFFEVKVTREPVIYTKNDQRGSVPFLHGRLEELGTGIGNEGLQPFIVSFEPRSDSGSQPLSHEGSEFIYCISGKIIYNVIGQEYTLEPGDTLLFASKMPHTWYNPLEEVSKLIIVLATADEPRRPVPVQYPV